ncbi:ATP synthase F0 subunit B [Candidatus Saganbacteria bacterium]|uniref:ATP synthase subunit b n=1 Tax=Candidatus Saganbacteria bacterium TaxID=2575572 RepID=A0A9D6ULN2_UNCSA|nr:ATP synthase F0 subunit B [Candidatus Saganbacteria bacterium]
MRFSLAVCWGFIIAAAFTGAAHASGIPLATEWDMARDGGRILNAAVVLGAVAYLVIRWGGPVFRKRAEDIAFKIDALETAKRDAANKLKEYEERLAKIEAEANRLKAEARAEGDLIKSQIIGQAEQAAKRIIEKAHEQIGLEGDKARERLKTEAFAEALSLAEDILKKNIRPEDHKRLIHSHIAGMEKHN